MVTWEYQVESTPVSPNSITLPNLYEITSEWLNQRGQDGWELVNVIILNADGGVNQCNATVIFKRPKTNVGLNTSGLTPRPSQAE